MWTKGSDGIRIVLVKVAPVTLSAVTAVGLTAEVMTAVRHDRAFRQCSDHGGRG
jgi:hypothetical protein